MGQVVKGSVVAGLSWREKETDHVVELRALQSSLITNISLKAQLKIVVVDSAVEALIRLPNHVPDVSFGPFFRGPFIHGKERSHKRAC